MTLDFCREELLRLPDSHNKQIPSARPHSSRNLGARGVDLEALEVNLVALGVGLGAPGMHLAWVLLPASGALKICHNSNFYVARFLAQAHIETCETP